MLINIMYETRIFWGGWSQKISKTTRLAGLMSVTLFGEQSIINNLNLKRF